MSRQLDVKLDDLNKVMRGLRETVKQIPVRREGFKKLHDEFARKTATFRTEMNYARGRLTDN
jgi:hypothetical protein